METPLDFGDFRKLLEGKAHGYAHLDMARATLLKLVMRHFAPSPTSEARRCSAAAAAGLRRALRAAAIRLFASCRFTALKSTVFTDQHIPRSEVRRKVARHHIFHVHPKTTRPAGRFQRAAQVSIRVRLRSPPPIQSALLCPTPAPLVIPWINARLRHGSPAAKSPTFSSW